MSRLNAAQRVLTVTSACLLIALSSTMAWATAFDYQERGLIARGVSVNGLDLSGATEAQARDTIEEAVSAPLMAPLTVTAGGKRFTFEPDEAITVDVDGMLAQAYLPRRSAPFVARVRHDIAGTDLEAKVEPLFSLDASAVADWVDDLAAQIDSAAVDASLTVVDNRIDISDARSGARLDKAAAAQAIVSAFSAESVLASQTRQIEVPVDEVRAKVQADSFGKTIVVDLSQRRVRLFDGEKVEKEYPCAVGTPSHPTPRGEWEITAKRYLPTWGNPGSEWAKDMPKTIPPGPDNPLGTRAINLSAPGIRFHGTNNIHSVGTAASHGCMRMYRYDIEDLYERVEVGMKVFIVR